MEENKNMAYSDERASSFQGSVKSQSHADVSAGSSVSECCSENKANGPQAIASNEVDTPISNVDKLSWSIIIVLGMLSAFGPICTDLYLPAIPTITQELMTDPSTMQLTLTASFFGLAIGQLIIGPLSDAYGRKRPLYICLVMFVLSSLWCAYAPSINQLIVARFFQGISGASGIVLSRTIACDMYTGPRLTKFMSLLMTVNGVAPILGPIMGSAIVSVWAWPVLFVFLALWGAVLLFCTVTVLKETHPVQNRSANLLGSIKGMLSELTNVRFVLLSLALSFVMGAFFGYLASSPFIFQSIYGLSPFGYSIVFAINAFSIGVAANIAGFLTKYLKEKTIVYGAISMQILLCMVFIAVVSLQLDNLYIVALILGLFVSMMGAAQTAGFGIVMGARKGGAGSASGIFGVLTFIFGAITSPLVGLMGEQSMVPIMATMSVCSLMAILCFALAQRFHDGQAHEVAH